MIVPCHQLSFLGLSQVVIHLYVKQIAGQLDQLEEVKWNQLLFSCHALSRSCTFKSWIKVRSYEACGGFLAWVHTRWLLLVCSEAGWRFLCPTARNAFSESGRLCLYVSYGIVNATCSIALPCKPQTNRDVGRCSPRLPAPQITSGFFRLHRNCNCSRLCCMAATCIQLDHFWLCRQLFGLLFFLS